MYEKENKDLNKKLKYHFTLKLNYVNVPLVKLFEINNSVRVHKAVKAIGNKGVLRVAF